MLIIIRKVISDIYKSFFADRDGASGRKLSAAFSIVVMAGGVVTFRYTSSDNATYMLAIWLTFASLLLGLVTVQQIIELWNGKNNDKQQGA